ncbi:MAG: VWA domain-containing protein [Myxococcales bacterium]|nr:VWA domain-containing protein [Myxococcales bacterium]
MRSSASTMLGFLAVATVVCAACSASNGKNSGYDDTVPASSGSSSGGEGPSSSSGNIGGGSSSSSGTTPECAANVVSAKRAEVDIFVVIDTSGSMQEETDQVKANINDFATKIGGSGLDYRVVMIAEKPQALPIPIPGFTPPGICVAAPLGGPSCGDNAPVYHHIDTDVGSTDSFDVVLAQYPTYKAWMRPSATKVFIEITDDNAAMPFAQFDTQLLAKDPAQFGTSAKRKYIWNSICGWKKGTPVMSATKCGTAENIGDQYQQLSQLTGGIVDSVCEASYAGVFDNLAKGLVTKLGCEFAFPKPATGTADPDKIVVQYTKAGGAPEALTQVTDAGKCASVPNGWYYDNPASPEKIVFCPKLCESTGQDTSGKISVAVGCKAPPPK